MFTLRRAFAFWAALLAITVVGRAHAQTPTLKITKTGITHSVARSTDSKRGLGMINRADCVSGDIMTFPLQVSGFTNYSLQAWVGTNCTDVNVRQSTTQVACWKVFNGTVSGASTNTYNLQIPVSSMVSGYTSLFNNTSCSNSGGAGAGSGGASTGETGGSGGNDATSGNAGTGGSSAGAGGSATAPSGSTSIGQLVEPDAKYCDVPCPQNVTGATAINLFVMLVDQSSGASAISDNWSGSFKLVGPPAPDKISTGIGGNLLVVNFDYSTRPPDTTGNGFYLFCDPKPGHDAAADAGLIDPDAGTGIGLTCGDNPPQVLFKGNQDQDANSPYLCGSAQSTSTSANATGLINGVPYNVAVAAYDTYENVGPLSDTRCEIPQPVTGFFKAYRDAGGKAGGGFCSFSTQRQPFNLLALLGVGSFLVLRRRRAA